MRSLYLITFYLLIFPYDVSLVAVCCLVWIYWYIDGERFKQQLAFCDFASGQAAGHQTRVLHPTAQNSSVRQSKFRQEQPHRANRRNRFSTQRQRKYTLTKGVVTRRPLEIRMIYDHALKTAHALFEELPAKKFTDFLAVKASIE